MTVAADFMPETKEIMMKGKPLITVRGLNLNDVSLIVRWNLPKLEGLFQLYQEHELSVLLGERRDEFLTRLLTEMPDLVFTVLAVAADEATASDKVARLPLAVQLDALAAVLELTFEESGGPANFVAALLKLTGAMFPTLAGGLPETPKLAA